MSEIVEFSEDVKRLKEYFKNKLNFELSNENIVELWKEYSSRLAAEWLALPENLDGIEEDSFFKSVLSNYIPKYSLLLFKIIDTTYILEKKYKITSMEITKEFKNQLLDLVPEFEKNYYKHLLNKKYLSDFFIRFNKNNENYLLYIINEDNIDKLNNIKDIIN